MLPWASISEFIPISPLVNRCCFGFVTTLYLRPRTIASKSGALNRHLGVMFKSGVLIYQTFLLKFMCNKFLIQFLRIFNKEYSLLNRTFFIQESKPGIRGACRHKMVGNH
uniref:Uncharacterized protein n=1 Tax=Octopus bimaculoides TaxID=37653 RepID=A0A0L8GE36_OCTBM